MSKYRLQFNEGIKAYFVTVTFLKYCQKTGYNVTYYDMVHFLNYCPKIDYSSMKELYNLF